MVFENTHLQHQELCSSCETVGKQASPWLHFAFHSIKMFHEFESHS